MYEKRGAYSLVLVMEYVHTFGSLCISHDRDQPKRGSLLSRFFLQQRRTLRNFLCGNDCRGNDIRWSY